MKKGVSPIIAEVLLVVIGISLALGIFVWTKNYTQNIQKGLSEQASCRDVNFFVGNVCYESLTQDSESGIKVHFNTINYSPNMSLAGFRISLEYEGGFKTSELDSVVDIGQTKNLVSDFIESPSSIKKFLFFPKIIKNEKSVVCEEQETIFAGEEINFC